MKQFWQKGRPEEAKVCPVLKFLKKPKVCQNLVGVDYLELFSARTRSFQVNKLSCKILVTISEEAQLI